MNRKCLLIYVSAFILFASCRHNSTYGLIRELPDMYFMKMTEKYILKKLNISVNYSKHTGIFFWGFMMIIYFYWTWATRRFIETSQSLI